MILSALLQYYHRLSGQRNSAGQPKVPSYGFSEEKIGYVLVLSKDGTLVDIQNKMNTSGKKPVPSLMGVPQPVKRTSGVKPNFLWDKTAYVLGVEGNKDKATAKETPWVLSSKTFDAFKQFHLEVLADTEDVGLLAFKKFLENWQPETFNQAPFSPEMIDSNVVFRLDGEKQYLHDCPAATVLWANLLAPDEGAKQSMCLVTGQQAPIARLHPAIKGVYGGQSSGGSIVSFNADAYLSYGKDQGHNAPVSEFAAFAYTTVLNYLLRREHGQCISIGDASTVFWAVADTEDEANEAENLFGRMLNMQMPDDEQERAKIAPILESISKGKPLSEIAPQVSPSTRFYVLGLAPNASRISIRYWMDTTFGELAENSRKHWLDLQLNPPAWKTPPSIWQLLIQTTPKRTDHEGRLKKSDSKEIPPQLAGEYMRAVLTGQPYPLSVLAKLIGRIRSDGYVNGLRVAMIKAVLNRNLINQKEVPVGLDKDEVDQAYCLGRLFAVFEKAQLAALGDLNASIRDKFYGSASSAPYSVFPLLVKGYGHHYSALKKGKSADWVKNPKATAFWLDQEVALIFYKLGPLSSFPTTMSLDEQGRFAVGYYHQKITKQKDQPDDVKDDLEVASLESQSDENSEE